jgi:hypothetical protein
LQLQQLFLQLLTCVCIVQHFVPNFHWAGVLNLVHFDCHGWALQFFIRQYVEASSCFFFVSQT